MESAECFRVKFCADKFVVSYPLQLQGLTADYNIVNGTREWFLYGPLTEKQAMIAKKFGLKIEWSARCTE